MSLRIRASKLTYPKQSTLQPSISLRLRHPHTPEALTITHEYLLPLPNPNLLPLPRRAPNHPEPHAELPPALAPRRAELGVRPRLDPAVVVHEPRLVALPRSVDGQVGVPVQPQVVVALRVRRAAWMHPAQVRDDERARLQVPGGEEAELAVGGVAGIVDGLDSDERAWRRRGRGWDDLRLGG
ncbi:unnamed protein product [Clonostachys byssicola]|uniref:Uncharacterized protein n=1 Tax=Clonostachys byssicola TaxID=160290 RepID=A0A9N9UTM1_9HYPO|nr:unnamed protein product [Clonostachys byssicola]